MRLGLFGGTFDPIHYGHLLLAECCREQCALDEVWFLPTAVPPHKQDRCEKAGTGTSRAPEPQGLLHGASEPAPVASEALTPAEIRIEMLELAIAGHPAFSISRYEVDRGGVNYTVETLAHFREECPEAELFFLMGADMFDDLLNWRDPARVCQLATPVVVRRPGVGEPDFECLLAITTAERIAEIRCHQVAMPQIGLSSTELRRRVGARQSIRYQTPRAVEKYIETHGLYRGEGRGTRGEG